MASRLPNSATFRPRLKRGTFMPGQFRVSEDIMSSRLANTNYSLRQLYDRRTNYVVQESFSKIPEMVLDRER